MGVLKMEQQATDASIVSETSVQVQNRDKATSQKISFANRNCIMLCM
jgi:hypothetical protein